MLRTLMLSLTVILSASHSSFPQSKQNNSWDVWQFLIGEWIGEGGGAPGQATGGFSFNFDLQGKILVRKNHADYPATKDRPAFSHDDLMIVYPESEGKPARAIYFDSEGHVIQYAATLSADGKKITLLSDASPSTPRFRFVYTKVTNDTLALQFDIAPPGKPDEFSKYVGGTARRKGTN